MMINEKLRSRIDSIASDRKSGAFVLCRKIMRLFSVSAPETSLPEFESLLDYASVKTGKSHSQMPSIMNLLSKLQYLAGNCQDDDFKKALKELNSHLGNIPGMIAENALEIIRGYNNFITLSNSGLVAAAFAKLHTVKKKFKLLICESYPGRESLVIARQLTKKGIDITIIPDTAVAGIIDNTFCAVTGCDAISPTHFRNKIGSLQLAGAAKMKGAKYIILGDSFKYVDDIKSIDPPEEVIVTDRRGFKRYVKIFEDVPLKMINKVITEDRAYSPSKISRIAKRYSKRSSYR